MVKFILLILFLSLQSSLYGGELFHRFQKTYVVNNAMNTRTISVGLILVDITKYREVNPSNLIYNQVMSYSKQEPYGDDNGRSTNVHETVHGINNELRNGYKKLLKKNVNGFYAGEGKGVIVMNPSLRIRDTISYIPNVVRGYRYNLYFVKQLGDWDDVPTYPIDEWAAYIAGAECAVDDTNNKIAIPKSDYVSGCLEFSIYCTALAMAVSEKDRDYWNNYEQFKDTIQYFLIKSEKAFFEGNELFPSKQQEELLENLRSHEDTKEMRQFLLRHFQGVFVD